MVVIECTKYFQFASWTNNKRKKKSSTAVLKMYSRIVLLLKNVLASKTVVILLVKLWCKLKVFYIFCNDIISKINSAECLKSLVIGYLQF